MRQELRILTSLLISMFCKDEFIKKAVGGDANSSRGDYKYSSARFYETGIRILTSLLISMFVKMNL
jgi:hypothetical protein